MKQTSETHPVTLAFKGIAAPRLGTLEDADDPVIEASLLRVEDGPVLHRLSYSMDLTFGEPKERVPLQLMVALLKPGLFRPEGEPGLILHVERMEFVNGINLNAGLLFGDKVVEVTGTYVLRSEAGDEIHRFVVESEGDGSVLEQKGPLGLAGSGIREAAFNNVAAARRQLRLDAQVINAKIKSVS